MTDVSLAATGVAEADHDEAPASPCEPDPGPRLRRWPDSEKPRIFAKSFVPGASVSAVATRHGVTASTLSQWRRQAVRGGLGPVPGVPAVPAVVPVVVGEGADPSTSAPVAVSDAGSHPAQRRWTVSEKVLMAIQ